MPASDSSRRPPHLLQPVRDPIRTLHYSYRTEKAYSYWIRQFILFSGKRHPQAMGKIEAERFLTYLATEQDVSASTQTHTECAAFSLKKSLGY